MHALLARQLRRHLRLDPTQVDMNLASFVAAVDAAYVEAESDRKLLEHSLSLAAIEMHERYVKLQRDAEELRRVQAARDTFFQMSSDLLCLSDLDGTIRQVNQTWTRLLGYPPQELVGRALNSLVHPDDAAFPRAPIDGEVRMRTKTGEYRHLAWSSTCDVATGTVFCSARDVTELKVRTSQITQAQKLQAVGQLASGVAHEINTPIQYLGDNLEFVRQSFAEVRPLLSALAGDPAPAGVGPQMKKEDLRWILTEVPRALEDTLEGVARVAELVRALKHFAHPDAKEKTLVDLNQSLTCTLTVARNELKDVADVHLELQPLPKVRCHGGAINQVFLNLMVNAAHAISDGGRPDRGEIRIGTRRDGAEVVIEVSDTGPGIPEGIRHRIFEPFFTTKAIGRGSGQGLALARAIIDDHQGKMGFDSNVGRGTTFWVRLPAAEAGGP